MKLIFYLPIHYLHHELITYLSEYQAVLIITKPLETTLIKSKDISLISELILPFELEEV